MRVYMYNADGYSTGYKDMGNTYQPKAGSTHSSLTSLYTNRSSMELLGRGLLRKSTISSTHPNQVSWPNSKTPLTS